MNEGIIRTIKKVMNVVNKIDNPKNNALIKSKTSKPVKKFNSFIKSKWL